MCVCRDTQVPPANRYMGAPEQRVPLAYPLLTGPRTTTVRHALWVTNWWAPRASHLGVLTCPGFHVSSACRFLREQQQADAQRAIPVTCWKRVSALTTAPLVGAHCLRCHGLPPRCVRALAGTAASMPRLAATGPGPTGLVANRYRASTAPRSRLHRAMTHRVASMLPGASPRAPATRGLLY